MNIKCSVFYECGKERENESTHAHSIKGQPHEGELTGRIVDELRIRLISGEQRTVSCPFATGGKSHRNRRRLQRQPMTTKTVFRGIS